VVKIIHRTHSVYENWTRCGRYVRGLILLEATRDGELVTCLACSHKRLGDEDEARAKEQSK